MNSQMEEPLRIMIAMNASYQCGRLVEIAAGFAARQHAELSAIFIEDINLLNLTHFPFTKEIDRLSAVERDFDGLGIAKTFQDRVEQARYLLSKVSERQRTSVSFKVVRGHFFTEALAAITERDVLFFGRETSLKGAKIHSRQGLHSQKKTKTVTERPVCVVFDGSPAAQRALFMGQSLAASEQKPLVVILAVKGIEQSGALRNEALQQLGNAPSLRFVAMPLANLEKLLNQIKTEGCSLVVVNRDICQESDETAKLLLEGANCPLVMVA